MMAEAAPGAVTGQEKKNGEVHSDKSLILRIQTDYLKYEREMDLARLQEQQEEEQSRRARRRLRFAVAGGVLAVLALLGIGLMVMIGNAMSSSQVLVNSFHAPPDLTPSGIDGGVIARGVVSELARLQRATRGMAARRGLNSPWTDGVELAPTSDHFSLESLSTMLRSRYGHDLHIGGELLAIGAGEMALTVRADGIAERKFTGPLDGLPALSRSAAEYVFSESEPGLWASHLTAEGRYAEAIEFARAAYGSVGAADKPYLLNSWGIALEPTGGSPREALALYREALKLKPDYWNAWTNVQSASVNLGDEQGAWKAGTEMLKIAGGRPGRAPEPDYQIFDLLTWNLQALLNGHIADAEATGGVGSLFSASGTSIADIQARLHDLGAAELALQTSHGDPNDPTISAMVHFVRARLATEAGDSARALTEMEAFGEGSTTATDVAGYSCWIAPAEEAAGHPDKADAILNSAGTFVDCYRFRADILDGRGDWKGAQKAYAAAVRLAPDLPAAYYSWGLALARHDDLAGAIEKFRQANERGPHWADPLKAWGDVLLKQEQGNEALNKYNEALKYAPNWAELKAATGGAQRKS
jgi:tetratricopeptide (TPR) repeat protein